MPGYTVIASDAKQSSAPSPDHCVVARLAMTKGTHVVFRLKAPLEFPILSFIRGCVVEAPQKRRENAEPV